MPTLDESYPTIVAALGERYGVPEPLRDDLDPFAAMVAAVLTRLVEPRKVDAALIVLRDAGLLEPDPRAEADESEVGDALRGGKVPLSARAIAPLRRLARLLVDRHGGSAESHLPGSPGSPPTDPLREELAGLNGIGPATADAILLFALRRGTYPVDRATYRVLVRHGWLEPWADYDEARAVVERQSPDDADGRARLSRWMERIGRDYCRVGSPRCEHCPLRPVLPEGGPREPGD
jgi:endonuclease-3 related protein